MATIINAGTTALTVTPDTSGALTIQANGTNAIAIDSSRNVGIGTTTPNDTLEVAGTNAFIRVNRTGNEPGITFRYSNSSTNRGDIAVTSGGDMYFTSGGSTERMRILSNGVVVMGTSTENGTNGVTFGSLGASTPYGLINQTASGTLMFFRYNSTTVGYISQNSSATAYNTSSDYRLKENIAPMTGALAKVTQLKPCTYTWKATGDLGQGFIAHELAEVVPDAVTGEKDAVDENENPIYQGVDTSFLVATLAAAIQEQQTIINDLKTRIETLENS